MQESLLDLSRPKAMSHRAFQIDMHPTKHVQGGSYRPSLFKKVTCKNLKGVAPEQPPTGSQMKKALPDSRTALNAEKEWGTGEPSLPADPSRPLTHE